MSTLTDDHSMGSLRTSVFSFSFVLGLLQFLFSLKKSSQMCLQKFCNYSCVVSILLNSTIGFCANYAVYVRFSFNMHVECQCEKQI